ncbi:ribonuclease E/G [Actinocorallia populi]|uniref:ribonuclease E/G n=1 Tax=Actinocorallia populi TaxID=2079200 RepID=UPI0013009AD5|nr:ribonuclease E/G [Actinocorallia populi]
MLDNENEPIADVTEETSGTETRAAGRRRAARPAGPPPEPEEDLPAVVTVPASAVPVPPEPAAETEQPEETDETQEEPAPVPVRAERRAARPAGPPPEAEDLPAVVTVPASAAPVPASEEPEPQPAQEAEEAVPAVAGGPVGADGEETPQPAQASEEPAPVPVRAERRAARPAGPPPEAEDVPAVITVSAAEAAPAEAVAAQQAVPDAAAEPAAPAVAAVRSERRAARPVGPPPEAEDVDAEEAAELGPDTELAEPVEDLAEVTGEAEAVLEAAAALEPVKRTRTRRRRAAEPADTEPPVAEPVAAETAAAGAEATTAQAPESREEPAEADKGLEAEEPKRPRTRKRAVRKTEIEPAEPAAEEAPAAEQPTPLVADPFAAYGQPFATPFAAPVESAPAAEAEPAGPVDVVFQPPMVVFQPPTVVEPKPPVPPAPQPPAAEPVEELAEEPEEAEGREEEEGEEGERPSRRRRRRGGRGRGRGRDESAEDEGAEEGEAAESEKGDEAAEPAGASREEPAGEDESEEDEETGEAEEAEASGSRRRRRRRRRSGGDDEPQPDDPPNTVVRVRQPRVTRLEDEVQAVRGSTRLEAKKQRRREGREHGRRRPPIITEAEFLARRESVERVMVVRQQGERTQIGVLEDGVLVEHYVDRASHQSYVGNVYLGKVQNVLPSMEAAFVDIGKGRNAVLYAGEVNWDVAGLVGQPRRIESALKSGQSVLVQVTKDPLGHKGARLTSQISLPGRYLVYVPDGSMTGISRKLPDAERSRLKAILRRIMPENAGVIVRTAAEGASEEELAGDVSRLAAQWEQIQKKMKTATAPSLLHGEPDMTIRVIRDIFNEDFVKLVVSGNGIWEQVQEYVDGVAPHLADRTELWDGDGDVFTHHRIDEQLAKALERKVWLPSGGSLVIDRTEAMTVVDVNTGKFTGQGGNLEETVTRNNLEAAEEIVRQLRLRDLGGIIVIDFIDMVLESNRDLVLRRLLECLARDRTKHQVAEVTSLGLVQMTRKRVGSGLLEVFSEVCECCNGRGIHVQLTPVEEGKPAEGAVQNGRKRKRKGEIERVVEAKLTRREAAAGEPEEKEPAVVVSVADLPAVEPQPAKPRRARRTRPAGPPPEEFEDVGTIALTLEDGETVRVEAVVGNGEAAEEPGPAEQPTVEADEPEDDAAPKRRRGRRLTRAEKIEAAKADATE